MHVGDFCSASYRQCDVMYRQWVQWSTGPVIVRQSNGGCSMVEYRTRNQEVAGLIHTRSTASNLEQVANLLCAQAHSASYPQRDGKWVVATATGWRPSVANWGDGVQLSVSPGSGWPHNALWHHWLMLISCHFRDSCKWCYSRCPDLYFNQSINHSVRRGLEWPK